MYQIIRKLSGRFESTCKPVKDKAGVLLRTAEEEMHWWREHFQRVFSHELSNLPEVQSGNELNVTTGRIERAEIKNAIKKKKSRKVAACDNIPSQVYLGTVKLAWHHGAEHGK